MLLPTLLAVRTYWLAMLIVQFLALAVALSYYWIDSAAAVFASIGGWKSHGGLFFSAITTVISGGVFPELLKRFFRPAGIAPPKTSELAHQFVMWALVGMLIDLFYRVQTHLFGNGTDALTLLKKILVDQLIFAPLICTPFVVAWFLLYEKDYQLRPWLRALTLSFFIERETPIMVAIYSFWPVMLLIIYSLPADLQFPLFLFANSAYSILMIFIIRHQRVVSQ